MAESLTFEIVPETTLVTFSLLQRSLTDLRRLIEEVDYAVTREKTGRQWVVEDIHSTNPTFTVRPLLDTQGVVDVIAEGLQVITREDGYEPPPFFPVDSLHRLRRMRGLFTNQRDRLSRIACSADSEPVATVDSSIGSKVDRVLSRGYTLLGSIEGQLDAVNLHGATTFTIWDRVTAQPVRCYFNRDEKERIKGLLERRVLVAGRVRYYVNGTPQLISNITDIRDMTPRPDRPDVRFGAIPEGYITGGRDSVEYVRTLRE